MLFSNPKMGPPFMLKKVKLILWAAKEVSSGKMSYTGRPEAKDQRRPSVAKVC